MAMAKLKMRHTGITSPLIRAIKMITRLAAGGSELRVDRLPGGPTRITARLGNAIQVSRIRELTWVVSAATLPSGRAARHTDRQARAAAGQPGTGTVTVQAWPSASGGRGRRPGPAAAIVTSPAAG